MRSYKNKDNETIRVSKEHLDMAVKIKVELQKASPSLRCSWAQHKKLMIKNGFEDSENSESYRCLIKNYQKDIGELPQVKKYADMVSDNKIESIKGLVGELAYTKREAQNQFRELNKVKRDVIDKSLLIESIEKAFINHDFSKFNLEYSPVKSKDKKMIVCLSDLHIGALVDLDTNKYNFKVATDRMSEYLYKVVDEAKSRNVSDIYLINLGDSIENPYMHNLAFSCEFTLQEQIVLASDIIIKFMMGLVEAGFNITFSGIAGNHDRLNSNKRDNLDGDHAVKGINKAVESFIDNAKVERAVYRQAKDYEHSLNINGLNIKFVHGDLDNPKDKNLLARHSSIDGVNYSMIVMGHYHHHENIEVGVDQSVVIFGSMKGVDNYSVNHRLMSSPSQGVIIVDEDGGFEVKQIKIRSGFGLKQ